MLWQISALVATLSGSKECPTLESESPRGNSVPTGMLHWYLPLQAMVRNRDSNYHAAIFKTRSSLT